MQATQKEAESPKIVLLGKLAKLIGIKPDSTDRVDAVLVLLQEIISFEKAENGVKNAKGYLFKLSQKQAFFGLCGVHENNWQTYGVEKPYSRALGEAARTISDDPIFEEMKVGLVVFGTVAQIETLLRMLLENQMYDEIMGVFRINNVADEKIAAMMKFYLANLANPRLLALAYRVPTASLTPDQRQTIYDALLSRFQNEENPESICSEFLKGLSGLTKPAIEINLPFLVRFLRDLAVVRGGLCSVFFSCGFRPLARHILPKLEEDERNALLADPRLKLTLDEADAMVLPAVNVETLEQKEQLRMYLNRLSQAIHYATPSEQTYPRLPQKLVEALAVSYGADAWGTAAKSQFLGAFTNPFRAIYEFSEIESVPALIALFQQFSLQETTKKMCFLETPHEDGRHELSKKAIPFVQSCRTLAKNMDAKQAKWLLEFLIQDKSLHCRIADLIWQPETNDAALIGYLEVYIKTMLDPNADPGLKKILSPLGGLLMKKMSDQQLRDLVSSFFATENYDILAELLFKCPEGGKDLPDEVAKELLSLLLTERERSPVFKRTHFGLIFTYFCARLVPLMSEAQRLDVLSDSDLHMVQPLVQRLYPKAGNLPAELSSDCLRVLVLRSAREYNVGLNDLIEAFVSRNNDEQINLMFTEYLRDKTNGDKLRDILVHTYFCKFLPRLIAKMNVCDRANDICYQSVMALLERSIELSTDENLRSIVLRLVAGREGDQPTTIRYGFITADLFKNKKFQARLFKVGAAGRLFTQVVDSFVSLDQDCRDIIIGAVFADPSRRNSLIQLLSVFTGRRVVKLKTNNFDDNNYNHCFEGDSVRAILNRARLPENKLFAEEIRRVGPDFILLCCQETATANSLKILEHYLDFGCEPSEKDMRGQETRVDYSNPFHMAAVQRSIPMLRLLLPKLRRVSRVLLGMMLRVQTLTTTFSLEAFALVFNAAKEKDPTCFQTAEMRAVYQDLLIPFFTNQVLPFLEAGLLMIKGGLEPTQADLERILPRIYEQDPEFHQKFEEALIEHSPNSYLMVLINMPSLDSDHAASFSAGRINAFLKIQLTKLSQSTLKALLGWAKQTKQPEEYIQGIDSKIKRPVFFAPPVKQAANRSLGADTGLYVSSTTAAASKRPVFFEPPQSNSGSNRVATAEPRVMSVAQPVVVVNNPGVVNEENILAYCTNLCLANSDATKQARATATIWLKNSAQVIMREKLCPALIVRTLHTLIKNDDRDEYIDDLLEAFGLERLFSADPYAASAPGFFSGWFSTVKYSLDAAAAYLLIESGEKNLSKVQRAEMEKLVRAGAEQSPLKDYLISGKFVENHKPFLQVTSVQLSSNQEKSGPIYH